MVHRWVQPSSREGERDRSGAGGGPDLFPGQRHRAQGGRRPEADLDRRGDHRLQRGLGQRHHHGQPGPADGHGQQHQHDCRQPGATLTYTYTGLVNGDTSATFTGSLATTATSSSPVGQYPITDGTLAATGNYTIGTFKPGTLTVQSAPQTLPADLNGKTPGPPPASTGTEITTQGLVNGHPVPRVILSSAGWRSRGPWRAHAMRPRPAQQLTKTLVESGHDH